MKKSSETTLGCEEAEDEEDEIETEELRAKWSEDGGYDDDVEEDRLMWQSWAEEQALRRTAETDGNGNGNGSKKEPLKPIHFTAFVRKPNSGRWGDSSAD